MGPELGYQCAYISVLCGEKPPACSICMANIRHDLSEVSLTINDLEY